MIINTLHNILNNFKPELISYAQTQHKPNYYRVRRKTMFKTLFEGILFFFRVQV